MPGSGIYSVYDIDDSGERVVTDAGDEYMTLGRLIDAPPDLTVYAVHLTGEEVDQIKGLLATAAQNLSEMAYFRFPDGPQHQEYLDGSAYWDALSDKLCERRAVTS